MNDETLPQNQKPGASYYLLRFGAAILDFLLCTLIFYSIGMAVAVRMGGVSGNLSFNVNGGPAFLIFGFSALSCWLYFWLFEGLFGRTLGKMICNLKVIQENGKTCGFAASAIRNLLRIVDYFFFYLVGIISILVTKKQQRIGDLVAKTLVVRAKSKMLQILGVILLLATGLGSIWGAYKMQSKMISSPSRTSTAAMTMQNVRFTEGEKGPSTQKVYEPSGEIFLAFDLAGVPLDASENANTVIKFEAFDPNNKLMLEPTLVDLKGAPPNRASQVPVNYHLTLHAYVTGGEFPIQITAQDNVRGKVASQRVTYQVKGPQAPSTANLGAQDYTFFEGKNGPVVPDANFIPGSEVTSKFNVIGFKLNPQNQVNLRLDLFLVSSSGEKLLSQPNIINASNTFFYPPSYLPLTTTVTTPSSIVPGIYTIHYILHDDIAGTQISFDQTFNIK